MRNLAALTAIAMTLAFASAAGAVTLTNNDENAHTVIVTTGDEKAEVMIEPNEVLEDLCSDKCTLTLESGSEETFDAGTEVSISGGAFSVEN